MTPQRMKHLALPILQKKVAEPHAAYQASLFPADNETKQDTTSTFFDNLSLPVHRWFRYSAGFSALWVREIIEEQKSRGNVKVLDPFCGSGTVLLEGERAGMESTGVEAHPFIIRVGRAKLHWRESPREFRAFAQNVVDMAYTGGGDITGYPSLINKCFPPEILVRLDSLRRAVESTANGSPLAELTWLALASIIRECSPVGTAQWQYVLPSKSKAKVPDPFAAFLAKVRLMSDDMVMRQRLAMGSVAQLHQNDARMMPAISDNWADFVITSPPYANNYDYADATRLEMSFFREIQGWGDLHLAVRQYLIHSCSQHSIKNDGSPGKMLSAPALHPIREELTQVYEQLEVEKQGHGGKKNYHQMIVAYFSDMAKVWLALRRVTRPGAMACFVVGDSAPYGVYIPVDRWLGELAVAAGFTSYHFDKIRDRNTKWKNRKHQVPLNEGHLWVQG